MNAWFLTEEGQQRLGTWLQSGCYEVDVPEEGALASVTCLLRQGHAELARSIVDELAPYFARMRFYPRPTDKPRRSGTRVSLEKAGTTAERLAAVTAKRQILEQKESVTVWTPLYDEIVALFLETMLGEMPVAQRDSTGAWLRNSSGTIVLAGGWPCAQYPQGWPARAQALLDRYKALRVRNPLCQRPEQPGSGLGLLLSLLGLLHPAFDRGGALGVDLFEPGHDLGLHDPEKDRKGHDAEDQLDGVREDRVGRGPEPFVVLLGGGHDVRDVHKIS